MEFRRNEDKKVNSSLQLFAQMQTIRWMRKNGETGESVESNNTKNAQRFCNVAATLYKIAVILFFILHLA